MMKLYQKTEIHHLSILEYKIFHLSMNQASKLYKNDFHLSMYQASKLFKNYETLPINWKKHHLGILEYKIFHLSSSFKIM